VDSKYAKELLARGDHDEAKKAETPFVSGNRTNDTLAEQLAEEFVETATSGEDEGEDVFDQQVDEESGGPFVQTKSSQEFAHGTDASNPKGAKREPFPKT
jgi:hypothetical protein